MVMPADFADGAEIYFYMAAKVRFEKQFTFLIKPSLLVKFHIGMRFK